MSAQEITTTETSLNKYQSSRRWQAVKSILDTPALGSRIDSFIDNEAESIDSSVLDAGWSSCQYRLLEIALSVASDFKVCLSDAIYDYGETHNQAILNAFVILMT